MKPGLESTAWSAHPETKTIEKTAVKKANAFMILLISPILPIFFASSYTRLTKSAIIICIARLQKAYPFLSIKK